MIIENRWKSEIFETINSELVSCYDDVVWFNPKATIHSGEKYNVFLLYIAASEIRLWRSCKSIEKIFHWLNQTCIHKQNIRKTNGNKLSFIFKMIDMPKKMKYITRKLIFATNYLNPLFDFLVYFFRIIYMLIDDEVRNSAQIFQLKKK